MKSNDNLTSGATKAHDAMSQVFSEGTSRIVLPDNEGKQIMTGFVAMRDLSLSSYRPTTSQTKSQATPSTSSSCAASSEKTAMNLGVKATENLALTSSKKKKAIKPLTEYPTHRDPDLQKRDVKYKNATIQNSALSLFKLPNNLFGLISDNMKTSEVNTANQLCRETNRLFQNQLRDEFKEKQQKLLQYVVDADLDHAEEFIKWHYRFQLVPPDEKIPELPEKDVIYVKQKGNALEYSLITSDGQCTVKDRLITLKELNEVNQLQNKNDDKDIKAKADQPIGIRSNFSKEDLKSLRPLILAVTNKNQHTQPKNNRCLLTMKGEVGCDLYLMPDEKAIQDSDATHLRLYRKNNELVYRINGKEHTFKKAAFNAEIANLFEEKQINKNGILTNNKLNEQQRQACKDLLAEAANRGHTSYVYSGHRIRGTALQVAFGAEDEEMVEMIVNELIKFPDGEKHIKNQIEAQFPEGWRTVVEKRHKEDMLALRKIRDAIEESKNDNDPQLVSAIQKFREHLEPKDIIETGKHWNAGLLMAALNMGHNEYFHDARKDNFFYVRVIGSINTHAPTNYAMAKAQGLKDLLPDSEGDGEMFNRSLKYERGCGSYYPLSVIPGSRLGIDAWVDCYYGGARNREMGSSCRDRNFAGDGVLSGAYAFFMVRKIYRIGRLMLRSDYKSEPRRSNCLLM